MNYKPAIHLVIGIPVGLVVNKAADSNSMKVLVGVFDATFALLLIYWKWQFRKSDSPGMALIASVHVHSITLQLAASAVSWKCVRLFEPGDHLASTRRIAGKQFSRSATLLLSGFFYGIDPLVLAPRGCIAREIWLLVAQSLSSVDHWRIVKAIRNPISPQGTISRGGILSSHCPRCLWCLNSAMSFSAFPTATIPFGQTV